MKDFNLLVVLGATASGKTQLAVQLANALSGEIISADSRQVYRGLDIGSGKDLQEYGTLPYHLIDIVDPDYEFSVFDFQQHFVNCFDTLHQRQILPVLCGGTGLYLEAALKGYRLVQIAENQSLRNALADKSHQQLTEQLLQLRPVQHNNTNLLDRERLIRAIEIATGEDSETQNHPPYPHIKPLIFGTQWERAVLRQRITQRLKDRLDNGLIEEVDALHKAGTSWEKLDFLGLEYRFVSYYLQGKLNKNDLFQKLNSAIHHFAKKQDTWFRRMQRRGADIHWLDGDAHPYKQAMQLIGK